MRKRRPVNVVINDEVERILQFMPLENLSAITVEKKLISERAFKIILSTVSDYILKSINNEYDSLGIPKDNNKSINLYSRLVDKASRIIDILYDIDWNY